MYIVKDWAGNHLFKEETFNSFEEGWEFLYANVDEVDENTFDDYFIEPNND